MQSMIPRAPPPIFGATWGSIAWRYVLAVAVVALATLIRIWLGRAYGLTAPFVLHYPAVLLAATIAGGGPGLLATALSAFATAYWVFPPAGFGIEASEDRIALVLFISTSLFLCVLAEQLHRARWARADTGNSANFRSASGAYTVGEPYWRTPGGYFSTSDSPYGTFDQGGNVEEWVETAWDSHSRVLRGGAYTGPYLWMRADDIFSLPPRSEGSATGFRLALVPEPATLTLFLLSAWLKTRRVTKGRVENIA
ncbi:MAG TPA: DUF4118 domain-containing protein [Phycisphaerae bacterium]|nr:DUF4118 domain-containing protein [Phycisphaerae bacterium]